MKTDDLIAVLATDPLPPAPLARVFWPVAALAAAGCFVLMAVTLELRPALLQALAVPTIAVKSILPLTLSLGAAALALRLDRPDWQAGRLARALLVVPSAAAVLAGTTLATNPPETWGRLATGETMVWCLVSIPTLALPVLAALLAVLRRGAPAAPARAGLAAGLAAGAVAATVYSLHCPEDSPLFFGAWYTTGILVMAALGAWAGARVLRW